MELDEQPDGQRVDVNLAGLRSGRPLVAVTMGDPAGVGPELCLRLLRDASVLAECQPVIFGDAGVLRRVAEALGWPFDEAWVWGGLEEAGSQSGGIWHLPGPEMPDVWQPGVFTAETGAASFRYIEQAIAAVRDRRVSAVTTGPINKTALHAAGIEFPGHTEIFAERTGAEKWCMMQWSEVVTCTFVTCHVGYAEVPALLGCERILDVIELTAAALRGLRAAFPVEAAAGRLPDDMAISSDGIVELVIGALPGWHFNIHGRARHSPGSWSCSLRRSDLLDDDEILGTGEARSLHQAVLAAVIRVAAWR